METYSFTYKTELTINEDSIVNTVSHTAQGDMTLDDVLDIIKQFLLGVSFPPDLVSRITLAAK